MSIGTLFLTIILIIIGVWLFRTFRKARRLYRMLFYGEMPDDRQHKQTHRHSPHQQKRPRRKSKLYTAQDGEYVDFEEINGTTTTYTQHQYSYTEEQIEDAEWEEIKP